MRTHLMINLFCSKCGSALSICYKEDAPAPRPYEMSDWQKGDPTGADCRYVEPLLVEPCQGCIEKLTGPARRIAEAIKEFSE